MPYSSLNFEVRNIHFNEIYRTEIIAVVSSIHHLVVYSFKALFHLLYNLRLTIPRRRKTNIYETLRY